MLCGIHAIPVQVEVDISTGLPAFEMVGYLSSEVREAKERVRTALHNQPSKLPQWNMLRTGILACCIFINLIVYYGLMSGTSALFCLLISLTGFVFCWPKQGETD